MVPVLWEYWYTFCRLLDGLTSECSDNIVKRFTFYPAVILSSLVYPIAITLVVYRLIVIYSVYQFPYETQKWRMIEIHSSIY
jgi:hypothetical protein